jgi:hypothetical protein
MIRTITQNKLFSTSDLGLASSLISTNYTLINLNKLNPKKVLFIFQKDDGIDEVIEDYWSDNLQVSARSYFDNIKMLKSRVYGN